MTTLETAATTGTERPPRRTGEVPTGWVDFLRAHAAITRRLDAALREHHGLSLNEYEVLLKLWLSDEGRLRRVDLAQHLLITQGGVTRLLAGLERQGLVERAKCDADARVVYAQLTGAGSRKLAWARKDHLRDVRRLFADHFAPEELQLLAGMLARLRGKVEGDGGC
jgi:DNA-binding MarR family transcriptional regulator